MDEEKTGFYIKCNWCGSEEVTVKPIDKGLCVIECLNPDCQETVHFMNINEFTDK